MTESSDMPTGVVARLTDDELANRWGRYLRIDDQPHGIYVFSCNNEDFEGEVFDNMFESWDEVRSFLEQLGEIDWHR